MDENFEKKSPKFRVSVTDNTKNGVKNQRGEISEKIVEKSLKNRLGPINQQNSKKIAHDDRNSPKILRFIFKL